MDLFGGYNQQNPYGQWQQQRQQQNGSPWIVVPTVQQIEQVSVQPGGRAWIMAQNEAVFALRTADQMGLITTDYYRFKKMEPAAAQSTPYVTKDQMDAAIAAAISRVMGGAADESTV